MTEPPYDPRAVANLLLDIADRDGVKVTNLVLQKLLYFAHGHFLIRTGVPLIRGAFEAWRYGPVHPAVYQAFKSEADRPIRTRAHAIDLMTGETTALSVPSDPQAHQQITDVLRGYGRLTPGRLVEISHAPRGPWAAVVQKANTTVALGMRIPDSVTRALFKYQKVTVGPVSRVGEPNEDTPLA